MKSIWALFLGLFLTVNFATAQDTLYVYQGGAVLYKRVITAVDSVTFNKVYTKPGDILDADGNTYTSVTIGTQTWLVENLRTTKYRNGDAIPNVTSSATWAALSTDAFCGYNNSADSIAKYGCLYNYKVVSDTRGIAPVGYRVATSADWSTLQTNLAATLGSATLVAKALATKTDWITSTFANAIGNNPALNNSTGFSLQAGGTCGSYAGAFLYVRQYAYFWTSTYDVPNNRPVACIFSNNANQVSISNSYFEQSGFSVRCIKE